MGDTKRVQIIQKRLDDAVRGTGNTPKALQYLKELDKIEMTVDILQATGIGKSVNRLRRLDMDIGQAAKALLKKWHHIVKASASSSQKKSNDNKAELTKAKLIKKESGRSSSRKRNAPAPVDIPSTSYHPMASASAPPPAPHPPPPPPPVKSKHSSIYWLFSDACTSRAFYLATVPDTDFAMAISKRGRSAVYSGRKTQVTTVQSLFQLSMKVIMDNIDALHEVGGTPYFILEPVLQRYRRTSECCMAAAVFVFVLPAVALLFSCIIWKTAIRICWTTRMACGKPTVREISRSLLQRRINLGENYTWRNLKNGRKSSKR
eukprot:m.49114 g.49114  ORF g.49114 m.49114 type:complete len:319 (+) comp33958_c0_seq5:69-1025(+)